MPASREGARLLARIDGGLAREFDARRRIVIAFSGGLSSLVLAALARKHGDLRCVVVGTRGAADVAAALVARDFLDYRLDLLTPEPSEILRVAAQLRRREPGLALTEVLDLVPLALVEARCREASILSGFGPHPVSGALRRCLGTRRSRSPMLGGTTATPSRALVLRLGRELALPEGFVGMGHRRPAEGSGIGPALRAIGHARHRSLNALVAGLA